MEPKTEMLCFCISLNVLNVIKMSSFQNFFDLRVKKEVIGARSGAVSYTHLSLKLNQLSFKLQLPKAGFYFCIRILDALQYHRAHQVQEIT